jgi:hypothetical protein
MTRKSRVFCPVEALEPKVLLSAVRTVPTVTVEPYIAPGATVPTTTVSSSTVSTSTTGNPRAPSRAITYVFTGSYGHAGRSLTVNATGDFGPLGQVSVNGSITLSGPKSAQNLNGLLTLTGSQGSETIRVQDSDAWRLIGHGPVIVTETVVGATGNGAPVQGEFPVGSLELGRWVGTTHALKGKTVPAHGSFNLDVEVIPPAP